MRWTWLAVLVACSGSGVDTSDPNDTDPNDTDPPGPTVETACDDTLDDDGDMLTDCADPDCAAEVYCSWPADLGFETYIQYEPSFEAELFGYDACVVHTTARITRDRQQTCPGCDRVFCGAFTYVTETCSAQFGEDIDLPVSGCYGLAFGNDQAWPISYINPDTSGWDALGTATPDGQGGMRYQVTSPVIVDGVDAGDLTSAFRFVED